jgi:hypothetical protein
MTRDTNGEVASVLGQLAEAVQRNLADEFLRHARAT